MSEQKKKLVAYHEAGHAILGALMSLGRSVVRLCRHHSDSPISAAVNMAILLS